MANYNDNDLDELDFGQEGQKPEQPPEKKPTNRNFIIALGIIGAVFVLITIALIVVAIFILPGQTKARQEASRQTLAANTATSQMATDEAKNSLIIVPPVNTATATPTKAAPTKTPVLAPTQTKTSPASVATATSTPVSDAQKATLSAQQTQLAGGKFTATVIATSTALPNTGFADEVGLPALLGLGAAMILVIFMARRLRASATR
jgi:LPXTG-motif cell wall-anchored protein